ncbi:MAG: NUDIX domain-containing protein [Aggregatilineales bacterium]
MSAEFYQSLPKKRMGAGCLLFDESGRVMLLQPTYKPTYEIPGGVIESDESPRACCEREVQEELSIKIAVKRLLIVDYNSYPDELHKTESLMFIFDGGTLTAAQIKNIQFDDGEIASFHFFAPDALPDDINPALNRRIVAALQQTTRDGAIYLENQKSPT